MELGPSTRLATFSVPGLLPGEMMAGPVNFTAPAMNPEPASVPPFMITSPVPVALPVVLLATRVPPVMVVPPV